MAKKVEKKDPVLPQQKKVKQPKKVQVAKQQEQQKPAQDKLKKFTDAQKKRTVEVKKHLDGKKSKMTKKEVESQIAFREKLQEKIASHETKIKKLNTDKCLTVLIKCMEVIRDQLEKNPTPTNKRDRERVIVSLIKINLVDKIFKDRQKVKEEKEYVKAARVQIKDFFKVLNSLK
jgi:predicted HicB family RNase H-like nuclease